MLDCQASVTSTLPHYRSFWEGKLRGLSHSTEPKVVKSSFFLPGSIQRGEHEPKHDPSDVLFWTLTPEQRLGARAGLIFRSKGRKA